MYKWRQHEATDRLLLLTERAQHSRRAHLKWRTVSLWAVGNLITRMKKLMNA